VLVWILLESADDEIGQLVEFAVVGACGVGLPRPFDGGIGVLPQPCLDMASFPSFALRRIGCGLAGRLEGVIRENEIAKQKGENYKDSTDGQPGDFPVLVRHGNSSPRPSKGAVKQACKERRNQRGNVLQVTENHSVTDRDDCCKRAAVIKVGFECKVKEDQKNHSGLRSQEVRLVLCGWSAANPAVLPSLDLGLYDVGKKKNAHHYEGQHELHPDAEHKPDPGCNSRAPGLP